MIYHVVETKDVRELERMVNALIAEGWLPSGGISVATYGAGNWWYYQAMVRRAA
jgi:hypothetical protein